MRAAIAGCVSAPQRCTTLASATSACVACCRFENRMGQEQESDVYISLVFETDFK